MKNQIDKKAIKISCIQTLPGEEFSVVEKLKQECELSKIEEYLFLKGFGAFDIILIYSAPSFDFHLIQSESIKGILKSSQFLCFSYAAEKGLSLYAKILKSPFIGFSLLKINPDKKVSTSSIEQQLMASIALNQPQEKYILGTLGWSEIILLTTSENIHNLINTLFWPTNKEKDELLVKTFSFITLNYLYLNKIDFTNLALVESSLKKIPSLDNNISKDVKISIAIASKPKYAKEIGAYWQNKNFLVEEIIGKEDTLVIPQDPMSWSFVVSSLLCFRREFHDKILSTNTSMKRSFDLENRQLEKQENHDTNHDKALKVFFEYNFKDLEKNFQMPLAIKLANHINSLNYLSQNPLIGNAYSDMRNYPEYILQASKDVKDLEQESYFITQTTEILKYGAELRSYGTYGTIDESTGQFSGLIKGGIQRSLLALECLPCSVLDRFGGVWQGFIIINDYKFSTMHEVINVPVDSIFAPKDWWCIYHEIAHILISNLKLVDPDEPAIKEFIELRKDQDWYRLLIEMTAEVIGFEIGFYEDYDLYLSVVWKYLEKIHPFENSIEPSITYRLRTFFVYLFEQHFRCNKITFDQFSNVDEVYKMLLEHIVKIEKITGRDYPDKCFIAARYAPHFTRLYPIAKILFDKFIDVEIKAGSKMIRDSAELQSENISNIMLSINGGRAWEGPVEAPEAILYEILKMKEDLKFEETIATTLTFWNIQRNWIEEQY